MSATPYLTAMMNCMMASMFAETATLTPAGTGTPFAIKIVMGDNSDGFLVIDTGFGENRATPATIQMSVCTSGMGRAPARGDVITVGSGQAHTGVWRVESAVVDVGDGVTLTLVQPTHNAIAGAGVIK